MTMMSAGLDIIEAVDADASKQIIKLRDPLLPAGPRRLDGVANPSGANFLCPIDPGAPVSLGRLDVMKCLDRLKQDPWEDIGQSAAVLPTRHRL